MTMGGRLALERRPGVGGRSATAALTFGVTAVAAALTFGAGLDRGSQDGRLSGQSFDTYTVRVGGRRRADRRRRGVARTTSRVVAATRIVNTVTPINGPGGRGVRAHRPQGPVRRPPAARPHPGGTRRDLVRPDRDAPPRPRHRRHRRARRAHDARRRRGVHAAGRPHQLRRRSPRRAVGARRPRRRRRSGEVRLDRHRRRAAACPSSSTPSCGRASRATSAGASRPSATSPRPGCCRACWPASSSSSPSVRPGTRSPAPPAGAGARSPCSRCSAYPSAGPRHGRLARRDRDLVAVAIGVPLGFAIGRTLWQALADDLPIRYVGPTSRSPSSPSAAVS